MTLVDANLILYAEDSLSPFHDWEIFKSILLQVRITGNLVSAAHLAALAIGYGAELCSTDSDFAKFPGLRWRNPLG